MTGSWWVPAVLSGALVCGYVGALMARRASLPAWSPWRTMAWLVGTLLVGAALSPPLADLAHHDHRFHMVQHLLLGMYAPLGLVLGAPVTLLLGSLPRVAQLRVVGVVGSQPMRVVAHPISAALLNIGGMFLLYLTPLYALSMQRAELHGFVLAHFLVAGYLYTWAIAGPDPAPRRPGMGMRVAVLVAAAGAHAYLGKLLYANAHQFAGGHGPASTMETAAQWMYYGGDIAEILLAVMLFAWWYRQRRGQPRTALARAAPP